MDHKEKQITNLPSRPRGRMMDFAPRNVATTAKKPTSIADKEVHRHELAMREYARREEIARQIERQKEEELLKIQILFPEDLLQHLTHRLINTEKMLMRQLNY
jgi:hypothetical protein